MLMVVPVLVTGLSLILWQDRRWFELVTGLGLVGLSVAGLIDLAGNCTFAMCEEHDPAVLTAGWLASASLLVSGGAGLIANAVRR
jgi:hypothetical protein